MSDLKWTQQGACACARACASAHTICMRRVGVGGRGIDIIPI